MESIAPQTVHHPRPRRPWLRRCALAAGMLAALMPPVSGAAATAAAATGSDSAIYLDPPKPMAPLAEAELRAPLPDSVAAAAFPALAAARGAGRLDEARALAQSAADAAGKTHGARDTRTLDARLNLALIDLDGGNARAAGEQFTSLIDEASAAAGLRAPQLETAWYGLGLSLLVAGNPADAERAFAAALQQKRINDGLHSEGQIGYLDAMSLTAARRGRLELADSFQLRRIELIERLHDDKSIERADAAKVLADWYSNTERPRDALLAQAYRLDILTRIHGRDDPRLVPALLDEARSYALVIDKFRERPVAMQIRGGTIIQSTEQPLNVALRLLKKNEVKLSDAERAALLIQIGDVHWIQGDRKRALNAWQLARAADAAAARRLARPEALEWPNDWPNQAGLGAAGALELRFSVSERGKVSNIAIAQLQPAGDGNGQALYADLRKALGKVRFRPALGTDSFETRDDVRYRHLFQPKS